MALCFAPRRTLVVGALGHHLEQLGVLVNHSRRSNRRGRRRHALTLVEFVVFAVPQSLVVVVTCQCQASSFNLQTLPVCGTSLVLLRAVLLHFPVPSSSRRLRPVRRPWRKIEERPRCFQSFLVGRRALEERGALESAPAAATAFWTAGGRFGVELLG